MTPARAIALAYCIFFTVAMAFVLLGMTVVGVGVWLTTLLGLGGLLLR